MGTIYFSSADKNVNIIKRKLYKNYISEIFLLEKVKLLQVRFIFCSDEFLLKINKFHLQHNYYTDVISFNLSNIGQPVNGEVYMSVDRIKENAKLYLVSYQNELLRVMIHGCLHLCGYKDNTSYTKKKISKKENYFLNLFLNFLRET